MKGRGEHQKGGRLESHGSLGLGQDGPIVG
jgi:hypothetical protein